MRPKPLSILVLILATLLVVCYFPWLTGASNFYFEDTANAFEPFCTFIGRGFRALQPPLWNPYHFCGMPEIAFSSPNLWYPPNLLFAILPFSSALSLQMIFSQVLSGAGAFLLVQSFGWGLIPALTAASIMGLSGYMFAVTNNYTLAATAAWLPLTLFCTRRAVLAEASLSGKWFASLSGCLWMMLMAGRPEIAGPGLVLIGSYSLCCVFMLPSERRLSTFANLCKALAIAILLAMPTYLPTIESFPYSRRATGLTKEALMFSANWYDLLGMFVSRPAGDLQINALGYRAFVQTQDFPVYVASAFVGPVALVLAAFGLQKGQRSTLYYCAILATLVSVLIALGGNVPIAQWAIETFPILSILRFPSKILYFVTFFLALFAARGMRNFVANEKPHAALAAAIILAGLGAWCALAPSPFLPFTPVRAPEQAFAEVQHVIGINALLWSSLGIASVVVLWTARGRATGGSTIILALVTSSLVAHQLQAIGTGAPSDFYRSPSIANAVIEKLAAEDHARNYRACFLALERLSVPPVFHGRTWHEHAYEHYQYQRQLMRPFSNSDFDKRSPYGLDGSIGVSSNYFNLFTNIYLRSSQAMLGELPQNRRTDVPLARMLANTGTRYVITQAYRVAANSGDKSSVEAPLLDSRFFALRFEHLPANIRVYSLINTIPRGYLSYRWRVVASEDDLFTAMFEAEKSGFDPAAVTLLDGRMTVPEPAGQAMSPSVHAVELNESHPERVELQATATAPAIVVLSDQYYPGWTATVDGQKTEILRCNGFLRGVAIPAGTHTVIFEYRPMSLYGGFMLAILALFWAYWLWLRRR